jgi:exosome complex exonuclease RRP6
VLDVALDRCDAALDAAARGAADAAAAAAAAAAAGPPPLAPPPLRHCRAPVRYVASLARPQDAFPDRVDNSPAPFLLPPPFRYDGARAPTHARAFRFRLSRSFLTPPPPPHPPLLSRKAGPFCGDGRSHPLGGAIAALRPEETHLSAPDAPTPPRPLADTPCTFVDTPAALAALAAALAAPEGGAVAVDLEAHSYRSYQGFTCLMQLSTRSEDYLVDTLALRGHIRNALAPFFQDANIVKVMHGADSDVAWLQRDFGVYILRLFDTGQAARLLALPSAGLAHLLQALCGVRPDKRFQLADWRLRPLSDDMVHYARCDTHYLLYAYDRLRDMLRRAPRPGVVDDVAGGAPAAVAGGAPGGGAVYAYDVAGEDAALGALPAAWARSGGVALRVHRREPPDAAGAAARMAERAGAPLGAAAAAVLAALCAWRDAAARAADESTGYVLSAAVALRLARAATGSGGDGDSGSVRGVAAACGRDAPFALARAGELAHVIATARAAAEAAAQQQQQQAQPAAPAAPAPAPLPLPLPLSLPAAEAPADDAPPPRKRRAVVLALGAAPPARAAGGLGAALTHSGAAGGAGGEAAAAAAATTTTAADAAGVRATLTMPYL